MTSKHSFLALLFLLFLAKQTFAQCPYNHTLISVMYASKAVEVCIPNYLAIRHCISYWTSTPVLRYSVLTKFQCSRCGIFANEQFIINLATLSTASPTYYLTCIPQSLKTMNCEYYLERPLDDNTSTFECGSCPSQYPVRVKGSANEYSFCSDKEISKCLSYGQYGVDRNGFVKVRCDSCEAGYAMDFGSSKCLEVIENCYSYDSFRKCISCNYGFYLTNGQCYKQSSLTLPPSNVPTSSEMSYSSTPTSNQQSSTSVVQPPCLQYSRRSNDICMKCKENYILWNSQCYLCPDGNYINSQGQCMQGRFPNCGSFNEQGLCLTCKDNFRFNYDLSACVSVFTTKTCPESTSTIKYVLVGNICVAVDINCQDNSYGVNGCFGCKSGYYIWQGICYFYR